MGYRRRIRAKTPCLYDVVDSTYGAHTSSGEKIMNKLQRLLITTAALATTTASVAVIAPPASASPGSCYSRGGYAFRHNPRESGSSYYDIDVWRGSQCSGNPILSARASRGSRTGDITLTAWDLKCDHTGLTIYTHGPSHPSPRCGGEGGSSNTF